MGKLVIGLGGFVVFALSTVGAIIAVNQSPDVNMKKWLPTIEFLKVIFPEDSLRKKTIEDSLENFSEDRFFMIKKGEALSHIADRLHAQKLIRSSEFFKLVTVVYGTQKKVKAGYFSIPPPCSPNCRMRCKPLFHKFLTFFAYNAGFRQSSHNTPFPPP